MTAVNYFVDGETLYLRNPYHKLSVRMGDGGAAVFDALERIAGGASYRELAETIDADDLDQVLASLRERRFVFDERAVPDHVDRDVLGTVGAFSDDPEATCRAISEVDVAVVGDGELAGTVERSLERLGFSSSGIDDCDYALVLADEFTDEFERAVELTSAPVIPAFTARSTFVGPAIGTVCRDCYRARRLSNLQRPGKFVEFKRRFGGVDPADVSLFARLVQRYLVDFLADPSNAYVQVEFDHGRFETRRHLALPRPTCERCRIEGLEDLSIRDLVSPRTGVVTTVERRDGTHDFDGFHLFRATTADKSQLLDGLEDISTGGFGIDRDSWLARRKALGESLERYSLSFPDRADVVTARMADLDDAVWADPYHERQYEREDFPYRRLPDDERIDWVPVERFSDGREVHVPASRVYQPYDGESFGELVSTGVACHTGRDEALLGGLLEVVERDSIAIAFLNGLRPPRLAPDLLASVAPDHLRALARYGLAASVVDLTLDTGIPCYFAVATDDGDSTSVGAGCDPDPRAAVHTALAEAMATFYHLQYLEDPGIDRPGDISHLHEHMLYYQGDNRAVMEDALAGMDETDDLRDPVAPGADPRTRLEACVDSVEAAGMAVYVRDITPADVAVAGLVTTRVVVPSAVDLNVRYDCRKLGHDRLAAVPPKLGYAGRGIEELHDHPHPMP